MNRSRFGRFLELLRSSGAKNGECRVMPIKFKLARKFFQKYRACMGKSRLPRQ